MEDKQRCTVCFSLEGLTSLDGKWLCERHLAEFKKEYHWLWDALTDIHEAIDGMASSYRELSTWLKGG